MIFLFSSLRDNLLLLYKYVLYKKGTEKTNTAPASTHLYLIIDFETLCGSFAILDSFRKNLSFLAIKSKTKSTAPSDEGPSLKVEKLTRSFLDYILWNNAESNIVVLVQARSPLRGLKKMNREKKMKVNASEFLKCFQTSKTDCISQRFYWASLETTKKKINILCFFWCLLRGRRREWFSLSCHCSNLPKKFHFRNVLQCATCIMIHWHIHKYTLFKVNEVLVAMIFSVFVSIK